MSKNMGKGPRGIGLNYADRSQMWPRQYPVFNKNIKMKLKEVQIPGEENFWSRKRGVEGEKKHRGKKPLGRPPPARRNAIQSEEFPSTKLGGGKGAGKPPREENDDEPMREKGKILGERQGTEGKTSPAGETIGARCVTTEECCTCHMAFRKGRQPRVKKKNVTKKKTRDEKAGRLQRGGTPCGYREITKGNGQDEELLREGKKSSGRGIHAPTGLQEIPVGEQNNLNTGLRISKQKI